jgi:predicted heme/steroid binding protein
MVLPDYVKENMNDVPDRFVWTGGEKFPLYHSGIQDFEMIFDAEKISKRTIMEALRNCSFEVRNCIDTNKGHECYISFHVPMYTITQMVFVKLKDSLT